LLEEREDEVEHQTANIFSLKTLFPAQPNGNRRRRQSEPFRRDVAESATAAAMRGARATRLCAIRSVSFQLASNARKQARTHVTGALQ
jgi:hypothetical protein